MIIPATDPRATKKSKIFQPSLKYATGPIPKMRIMASDTKITVKMVLRSSVNWSI